MLLHRTVQLCNNNVCFHNKTCSAASANNNCSINNKPNNNCPNNNFPNNKSNNNFPNNNFPNNNFSNNNFNNNDKPNNNKSSRHPLTSCAKVNALKPSSHLTTVVDSLSASMKAKVSNNNAPKVFTTMLTHADVNASWAPWKTHVPYNHASTVVNASQLMSAHTNANAQLDSMARLANWTLVCVKLNNHAVKHQTHVVNRSDWVLLSNTFAFANKKLRTVLAANKLNATHAKVLMDRNHWPSATKVSSCATVNVCSSNHAQVVPFGMTPTRLASGPICKVLVLNKINRNHTAKDTVNNKHQESR